MANNTTLLILLMAALISSATSVDSPVKNQDLLVAMEEMQTANYFTFVMLINMSPVDQKLTGNVTFFMPKDKALSRANMLQQSINDFLLRHSIPSALLFENLQLIPSGSLIPTSLPDYMLEISNDGRKNFSLNNVKITSPNLCTAGSSIRCHGIDAVLNLSGNNTATHSCSNSSSPVVVMAKPPTSPSPSAVSTFSDSNQAPLTAPQPSDSSPQKSGASQKMCHGGLLNLLSGFAMILSLTGGLL